MEMMDSAGDRQGLAIFSTKEGALNGAKEFIETVCDGYDEEALESATTLEDINKVINDYHFTIEGVELQGD